MDFKVKWYSVRINVGKELIGLLKSESSTPEYSQTEYEFAKTMPKKLYDFWLAFSNSCDGLTIHPGYILWDRLGSSIAVTLHRTSS